MLVLWAAASGGCRAEGPTATIDAAAPAESPADDGGDGADATYAAFSRAQRVLDASLAASKAAASRSVAVEMTGTLVVEGHYSTPYETKSFEWRVAAVTRADGSVQQRLKLHTEPLEGLTACRADEAVHIPPGSTTAERAVDVVRSACRAAQRQLPHTILSAAQRSRATLRWLGEQTVDGEPCDVIGYVDEDGRYASLIVERRRHVLVRWERLVAHPQLGDTTEWVAFSGHRDVEGMLLPTRRVERRLGEDSADTRDVEISLAPGGEAAAREAEAALDASAWVSIAGAAAPAAPAMARRPPEVTEIAPDIFLVALPEEDVRVMFARFDEYVVALDAPLRSAAGEDVLAAIRAHAGDRPVRYFVIGHHHPHHMAGLRPFIHAGATVVTTKGNVKLVEDYATRPHRLEPDDLARDPRAPRIEVVDGRRVIADEHHRLELHDIGSLTDHTAEYLVYYFPREKLLVEGDLAWFPENGEVYPAPTRTQGLAEAIERLELDVEHIVQSWPLTGQKPVASRQDLENMLRAAEAAPKQGS